MGSCVFDRREECFDLCFPIGKDTLNGALLILVNVFDSSSPNLPLHVRHEDV